VDARPYQANVPGDFYIVDGCICQVPFERAPDLFGVCQDSRGYRHCFVKRQPENAEQVSRMIDVIQRADFGCLRYRGDNREIQQRLVEAGKGSLCDYLPPYMRQATRRLPWWHRVWMSIRHPGLKNVEAPQSWKDCRGFKSRPALIKDQVVFVTAAQPGTELTYAPEAIAALLECTTLTPAQETAFRAIACSNAGVVPVNAEEFAALALGDAKRVLELATNKKSNLHALRRG
jgi:hypothetical protein